MAARPLCLTKHQLIWADPRAPYDLCARPVAERQPGIEGAERLRDFTLPVRSQPRSCMVLGRVHMTACRAAPALPVR